MYYLFHFLNRCLDTSLTLNHPGCTDFIEPVDATKLNCIWLCVWWLVARAEGCSVNVKLVGGWDLSQYRGAGSSQVVNNSIMRWIIG